MLNYKYLFMKKKIYTTNPSSKKQLQLPIKNLLLFFFFLISINVKNGVYSRGDSGNIISQKAVNKTRFINEASPGGSNASITLQWNASDELPLLDRNNIYLNHYISGAWDPGTSGITNGSNPYTFTRCGVTSFSPFAITSSAVVLPVTLLNFSATYNKPDVIIQWQTSSKHNTSLFRIERSVDGNNFLSIGNVNASGNSSSTKNYSYQNTKPVNGTNFYRLKIIDTDGKFTYSKIIAVKMENSKSFQIFPNPAIDILYVVPIAIGRENEDAIIQIVDLTGKKVKEQKMVINANTSLSIDISHLPKSIYNLILRRGTKTEQQKFVKQ